MNRSGKAPGTCEKHQKKIGQIEKVVERRNTVVHMETEWIGILFLLAVLFLGSPVHARAFVRITFRYWWFSGSYRDDQC
jgi:hypothetical protein